LRRFAARAALMPAHCGIVAKRSAAGESAAPLALTPVILPNESPAPPSLFVRAADALVQTLLAALLLFAPLSFGAVNAWSELVALAIAAAVGICLAARLLAAPHLGGIRRAALAPVVLFIAWSAAQLIALPAGIVRMVSPRAASLRYELLADIPGIEKFLQHTTLSLYPPGTRHDLRVVILAATVFTAVLISVRSAAQIKRMLLVISVIGGGIAILALAQDLTRTMSVYWRVPTDQLALNGPFFNHSHYAQFMNLSMGGAAALLLVHIEAARRRGRSMMWATVKWSWLIGIVLIGAATILISLSRGGFVSMLVAAGISIIIILLRRRILLGAITIAVLAAASIVAWHFASPAVSQRIASIGEPAPFRGRLQMIADAARMWEEFPLTGIGLGSFEYVFPPFDHTLDAAIASHLENEYVQAAAETGIVGFSLVVVFVAGIWLCYLRCLRRDAPGIAIGAIGLGYGLLAVMTHSLSDFGQHVPAVACLSAVTCALMVNLDQLRRADGVRARGRAILSHAAAGIILLLVLMAVLSAVASWRAEKMDDAAQRLARRLEREAWTGSDAEFDAALQPAIAAADAEPDNIVYRRRLNELRWHKLEQRRGAPGAAGAIRRLVDEMNDSRRLCPTYGHVLTLAGQIEELVLNSPAGAYHLRMAVRLTPNDPLACMALAKLEARGGQWEAAREMFRRAYFLDHSTLERTIDFYLHEVKRPDLLVKVLDDQPMPMLLMSTPIRKEPGLEPLADEVRHRAAELMAKGAEDPSMSASSLLFAADRQVEEDLNANAVKLYARAFSLDPSLADARHRFDYGLALSRLGRTAEAREQLRLSLKLDPNDARARKLLQELGG
jgi:O-antigen ligase/tetratricopeptide (TPR) repeat protein